MDLTAQQRRKLWDHLLPELEKFYEHTDELAVSPRLDRQQIMEFVARYRDEGPVDPAEAVDHTLEGLKRFAVHTPHPAYFGLFNPRSAFAGILADTITATLNPQLAAWSHAPFAAETEKYLIRAFGGKFGFDESETDGHFTSGGQEANLTAVLCALNHHFPDHASGGLQGMSEKPVIYCSAEAHHSVVKAATIVGLGIRAVRMVETDGNHRLEVNALERRLKEDRRQGFRPFLIVASMGATGTGAIDPIRQIAPLAREYSCWLHADAAYGGAVVLSETHRHLLEGIGVADSITFDAHKWLSVPMSAGMFITRHPDILPRTFRIQADYMPQEAKELNVADPFANSIQWSRRFTGLKLYLSLLIYGWEGFQNLVDEQQRKGEYLRKRLAESGWTIFSRSPLPVICFGDEDFREDSELASGIARSVVSSGKAWISVYRIGQLNTLRACITNYATTDREMDDLVDLLEEYR